MQPVLASFPEFFRKRCFELGLCRTGLGAAGLDVGEVIVELAQVVVVSLVVHCWEDAAAGQLWQILDGEDANQFEGQNNLMFVLFICSEALHYYVKAVNYIFEFYLIEIKISHL